MKTLTIIRHAKAEKPQPGEPDKFRKLRKKGIKQTQQIAQRMQENNFVIEAAFASTGTRAQETARLIGEQGGFDCPVTSDDALYTFDYRDLVRFVHDIDDTYRSVAIIGHNPALTLLVTEISDKNLLNIPTCGVVQIDFKLDSWKEIGKKSGRIRHFFTPKSDDI